MSFAQLALICGVAILGPLLSLPRGVHVPVVIGELLVGLTLGSTGLQVLDSKDPAFSFLGEVGFALVMFVAGSHVPVRNPGVRAGAKAGLSRAALIGVLALPVAYAVAFLFGSGHALLYAVLLASSSASVVLPALSNVSLTAPPLVAMLAQLAVADAACIVLVPFAIDPADIGRAAIGAALVLGAAALVYLGLARVERSGWRKRVHKVSEDRGLALELRVSLTLLFALAALATWRHVSVMLAGFAFGVAVSAVGEPRRLTKQLFALTEGLFAPLFFVWLGASLDLRTLAEHPSAIWLGLALGASALLVHGAMFLTRQPWPVAVVTAAQLGVPVAAATTGTSLGVLAPGEDTAMLLGALVTIAATALVTGRIADLARSAGPPERVDGTSAGTVAL